MIFSDSLTSSRSTAHWGMQTVYVYRTGMNHRLKQMEDKTRMVERSEEKNGPSVKELKRRVEGISEMRRSRAL
jgi:hypothetical protein